jgi:hypothetical protein
MDSVEGITSEDLGPAETSKQKTGADFVRDRFGRSLLVPAVRRKSANELKADDEIQLFRSVARLSLPATLSTSIQQVFTLSSDGAIAVAGNFL